MPLFSLASRESAAAGGAPEAVPSADVAASEPSAQVCLLCSLWRCYAPLHALQADVLLG